MAIYLERHVDQLSTVVAEFQQARPVVEEEHPPAPPLASLRDHLGASEDTGAGTPRPMGHGIDVLHRGLAPAFTSMSTPANGQSASLSPMALPSPYA